MKKIFLTKGDKKVDTYRSVKGLEKTEQHQMKHMKQQGDNNIKSIKNSNGKSIVTAGGGQTVVIGSIERSVIDSYIRTNLATVKWCYEKELEKNSALGGQIVISFVISNTGEIVSSKVHKSTMNNETVEQCVADRIAKIKFPKRDDEKIIIVNYPFVFEKNPSAEEDEK